MRDVVLLRVRDSRALERVVRHSLEILGTVYRGEAGRGYETWTAPEAGLAVIQATRAGDPDPIPMHRSPDEAFAYSGFVSTPRRTAGEVRQLLRRRWTGRAVLTDSPGGVATFFHADARQRRCLAWTSHGNVGGLFSTRGDDCTAISNRSLIAHLCGLQRTEPSMSLAWARRILIGNYSLWDDTPYQQTTQPPPRTMLVLADGELATAPHPVELARRRFRDRSPAAVTALNEAAFEAISVLRRWPRAELWLSGGKDSRYVAALVKAAGVDLDVVTHATPSTGEGPAAAAVARAVGVPLRFRTESGIATGEALVPTILANLRRCDGLLSENRQLAASPPAIDAPPVVHGHAHHPRGGFRAVYSLNRARMREHLVAQNIGDEDLVVAELGRERRGRLDEILSGYAVSHPSELAYWMYADWRVARWTIGAYTRASRTRPVLWPMIDERVLRVLSKVSSYDRISELAFFRALCALCPALAAVPLHEDRWKFDNGRAGRTEFARGFELRSVPFEEQGRGVWAADKRVSTIQPLFRMALRDLRCSAELRSLILPDVAAAACDAADPAKALGLPHMRMIRFMWKVVAIALVVEGGWFAHA